MKLKKQITQKNKKSKQSRKQKNDNYFKLPKHEFVSVVSTLSQNEGWGIKQWGIPKTWKITEGEGETIMVIDTGWIYHTDLDDNFIKGICTVKDNDIIDRSGHSVHCAGIIAAKNNNTGMVGVAPKSKVIAVKALGDDGMGSFTAIADALDYAIKKKPTVVSLSLGAKSSTKRIENCIKKLYNMGIPVICAAGNDSTSGVDYPGKYKETISVAAYDKNGKIANFSAIGDEVDFTAPGVGIYSTYLDNKYTIMSGTSMACPFIAGVVALLISKHKKQEKETGQNDCKTVDEVKQHLLKYTVDKGYVGKDKYWGYGIIDVNTMMLEHLDKSLNLPLYVEPNMWTKFKNWFIKWFN